MFVRTTEVTGKVPRRFCQETAPLTARLTAPLTARLTAQLTAPLTAQLTA